MKTKKHDQNNQILGNKRNAILYANHVDTVGSEGWQIRNYVIFPKLFKLMNATISTSAPIIDIGSGTGSLTKLIKTNVGQYVEGVDISKNFVALSKKLAPDIPFHVTGQNTLSGYGMHTTNLHLVLHCVKDAEDVIEKVSDLTMADGYVFATLAHPEYFKKSAVSANPNQKSYSLTIGDHAEMTYYYRTLEEYEAIFNKYGLQTVSKHECLAPADAPNNLHKYKKKPYFIIYVLQKKIDIINTALIIEAESGKIGLFTRSANDDKFPGVKSMFSAKQLTQNDHALSTEMKKRIGITPSYISNNPIGSILAKHKHANRVQYAKVNLYAVKSYDNLIMKNNKYYDTLDLVTPAKIKPYGGACTQLAYNFLQGYK